MKKPWTWRREARDIGMGLEERQRRETCNSITISKNKQKRKVVYNSVLNFEFLFYCNSWLFSVLRTALYGRWSHIWVIFKTFLFIYPRAIKWYTKMIFIVATKMTTFCGENIYLSIYGMYAVWLVWTGWATWFLCSHMNKLYRFLVYQAPISGKAGSSMRLFYGASCSINLREKKPLTVALTTSVAHDLHWMPLHFLATLLSRRKAWIKEEYSWRLLCTA